jgi:hypothetical protein
MEEFDKISIQVGVSMLVASQQMGRQVREGIEDGPPDSAIVDRRWGRGNLFSLPLT